MSKKGGLESIHQISLKQVFSHTQSSQKGLNTSQVENRLAKNGPNALDEKKQLPLYIRFLFQFKNFFSILLLVGATLSFISEWLLPNQGSIYIAYALIGVTLLNAIFTFIQEYNAQRAMNSFKNLMTTQVSVLRDGVKQQVDSKNLVVGDIIFLQEGDKISADARLLEVSTLKVDHSALTGESEPQLRSIEPSHKLAVRSRNMVLSGTLVQSGSGTAIVVATGNNTEIGKIAKATNSIKTETSHLQKQIGQFITVISRIAVGLGILFFIIGTIMKISSGNSLEEALIFSLIFAIGIIVANVPEGLLPTVTLTLSIAAKKLAQKKVLIKNIDAIETLGSLTTICSDKTGTLTENKLHVHGFYLNETFYHFDHHDAVIYDEKKPVRLHSIQNSNTFNDILVLCNNSIINQKGTFGDPTDICLKQYVSNFRNTEYIEGEHQRTYEVPFSSETKFMVTSNIVDEKEQAFFKGAPEITLKYCSHIVKGTKCIPLTKKLKENILKQNEVFAEQGFRVLGCAAKDVKTTNREKELAESTYTFYGLIVMQDPPRMEVPQAVQACHTAGIKIIVISGDQGTTVASIARQVGIIRSLNPTIIESEELNKMSDKQVSEILKKDELIFARALPQDKMRIVSLLKDQGEIVAVTGDGVNDAPALKRADVGLAMGVSGTEVAKEAADIVLLDDNFSSIVTAIKQGRTIYDNIKNFIRYILTSNTPEILPFLFFVLFDWPLALPVLLILAIDLGTDMIPAIGLGTEESSSDIMKRKPRSKDAKLLTWKVIANTYGFVGVIQTLTAYIVFFHILLSQGWSWGNPLSVTDPLYLSAVTGFFVSIVITQMFDVYACRTSYSTVFKKGFFSNQTIILGILCEIILIFALIFFTPLSTTFGTAPFPLKYIGWMIIGGIILLLGEEIRKYIYRKTGRFGTD